MPVNVSAISNERVCITGDCLTQLKQKGYNTVVETIPQVAVMISVKDQECEGHEIALTTTKKRDIENQDKIILDSQAKYSNTTIFRLIENGDLFNDKRTRSLKGKTSNISKL